MDYLNYVYKDDLKFQVLKELAENGTVSRKKMQEKFGRPVLDILDARKLIIRVFVKRGYYITSFYKLSVDGASIYFTLKDVKGDEDG